jgi:hypothetical protein
MKRIRRRYRLNMEKEDKMNRAIIYTQISTLSILLIPYIYSGLKGYTLSQFISIYNTYEVPLLAAAVLVGGTVISVFLYGGSRPLRSTYLETYLRYLIMGVCLGILLIFGLYYLGVGLH